MGYFSRPSRDLCGTGSERFATFIHHVKFPSIRHIRPPGMSFDLRSAHASVHSSSCVFIFGSSHRSIVSETS
ncbi:hypothetical protein CEXT_168461 [Caerostris extrusa]|uniref:Uncharacterized protein n=1 Tax=Caerostris extrusa TaxID=172846 RepID=A0AAV4NAQ4_CAEEX|nr:hypothetical protein CEXT_168461 [Caerostris extrusa]